MNDMTSERKKSMGCGGCLLYGLGTIFVVIALVVGGGYYTLMYTAYPLRYLAGKIENAAPPDAPITITDISGSFSTGTRIKRLKWTDGEIENLCFTYDNLFKSFRSKRFIFREISVSKAHINGLDSLTDNTLSERPTFEEDGSPADWDLFQIDKLSLTDIVLSNNLTGVSVVIPKFEWTGFKWEKGKTQFGTINADTPAFKLATGQATTPGFLKRFTGEIRPGLHTSIQKAFGFDMELGTLGKNTPCRLNAFDNAVTGDFRDDGTGNMKVQGLNLSAYFKDIPQNDIHLEIELKKEDTEFPFQIKSGSFTLGKNRFVVAPTPAKGLEKDQADVPLLVASAEGQGRTLQYTLTSKEGSGTFVEQLTTTPTMQPDDLIALVFYGKPVSELTAEEKTAAQELQKRFMPAPQ